MVQEQSAPQGLRRPEPGMVLDSLPALGLGFLICKTKKGGVLVLKALKN